MTRITPAQRLVLYYMAFEAIYHGKTWFTFEEIQRGTGLAARTLRAALTSLRRGGFVESYMTPGRGKRHIHRLRLEKILPEPEPEGFYLIDMADDILTPTAISIIAKADVVLYTPSVSIKKLEGLAKRLEPFTGVVPGERAVALAFNSLLDWDKVAPVATGAKYICASNLLDKAVGVCLTCGNVEIDLKTVKIKSTYEPQDRYELLGTIIVESCGGRKTELFVFKKT
ncbi:MAG: helix-turn-helix domain-containing protein [Pyrobaculum sp.]